MVKKKDIKVFKRTWESEGVDIETHSPFHVSREKDGWYLYFDDKKGRMFKVKVEELNWKIARLGEKK